MANHLQLCYGEVPIIYLPIKESRNPTHGRLAMTIMKKLKAHSNNVRLLIICLALLPLAIVLAGAGGIRAG